MRRTAGIGLFVFALPLVLVAIGGGKSLACDPGCLAATPRSLLPVSGPGPNGQHKKAVILQRLKAAIVASGSGPTGKRQVSRKHKHRAHRASHHPRPAPV